MTEHQDIEQSAAVVLIDDDEDFANGMQVLCASEDIVAEVFLSAQSFLEADRFGQPLCVVLDYQMPEIDGVELHRRIAEVAPYASVIMLTGFGDVPLAVQSMKHGALDFLEKPIDTDEVLAAIRKGMAQTTAAYQDHLAGLSAAERLGRLTERERQIFDLIARGQPNKLIAVELDVSIKTVEKHRSQLMRRLGIFGMAEVLKLARAADTGSS